MSTIQSEADRKLLADRFPKCFAPKGAQKMPVVVGIHRKIKQELPDLSMGRIHRAIANYVGGPTYLRNVVEGAPRVDLDGSPAGKVSAASQAYSTERLKKLEASWKWRKEAKAA
jgi:sRNA-binding protein